MGYHVILAAGDKGIDCHYVENIQELASLKGLTSSAIIYQSDERWAPIQVGTHEEYRKFLDDWYVAGILAEELFKELAKEHKLIVEGISQDQKSFQNYVGVTPSMLKRGDFLIRNARNVEVEVKCRSIRASEGGLPHYGLKFHEVKKLDAMQRLTGLPILIAFFERQGRAPIRNSLRMISVSRVLEAKESRAVWYHESSKELCIPLKIMDDGFAPVDSIVESIRLGNEDGGSWNIILNESREASARQSLIRAQEELCISTGAPRFLPKNGVCFACDLDLIAHFGAQLATKLITGCPICARSYCE
jgi:hypothetical protein